MKQLKSEFDVKLP